MAEWRRKPRHRNPGPWLWPILRGVPVVCQSKPILLGLNAYTSAVKHTIAALEVGDCFVVNGYPQKARKASDGRSLDLRATALQPSREVKQYAKDFGYKIKCRTIGRGVVMVWRVA